MRTKRCPVLRSLLYGLLASTSMAFGNPKVRLSKVKSLTLRSGRQTTARRLQPIPQLKCVGGDAKGLYEVDVMVCENMGSDYGDEDVSWSCTADVPGYFKLGATDVLCEGYESPDDPYILKGSCGVEYRLALTDAGYEKFAPHSSFSAKNFSTSNWLALGFNLIWISMLIFILWSACFRYNNPQQPRTRRPSGYNANGGRPWFGGGGDDDPPPPYDGPPPRRSSKSSESWRPGFWSGIAAGAAASYAMRGSGSGSGSQENERRWSGNTRDTGSSFSSSSPSASTYSTTGFGQTRRR